MTKLESYDNDKIIAIANRLGFTRYKLLQYVLISLLRYFDKDNPISDELETLIGAFKNVISGIKRSYNPIEFKDREKDYVSKAILFIKRDRNKDPQPIRICKDPHGRMTESYNVDDMLSDLLKSTDPDLYKDLVKEKKINNDFSIGQTLHKIVEQYISERETKDEIKEEVKSMFDDIRIPSGQKLNEGIYYKRKMNIGDYTAISPQQNKYIRADL